MKTHDTYWASASHILDIASPASDEHLHLLTHQALAHDIKQYGKWLIIKMCDLDGNHKSNQMIDEDGRKIFAKGSKIKNTYHLIGEIGSKIIFCEGFATGSAIHQATGLPVVVCFNENNLRTLPRLFRKRLPRAKFFIAADDDYRAGGTANVGVNAAHIGAKAGKGRVIIPLSKDKKRRKQDFADVLVRDGMEYLKSILGEQLR